MGSPFSDPVVFSGRDLEFFVADGFPIQENVEFAFFRFEESGGTFLFGSRGKTGISGPAQKQQRKEKTPGEAKQWSVHPDSPRQSEDANRRSEARFDTIPFLG